MDVVGRRVFSLFRRAVPILALAVLGSGPAWADWIPTPGADQVKRGEYLATVGDCVACHSAPGGKPFAGGLYMNTPVGKISTPNLTPDKETGIGNWTDDQFYRAMHEGIGAKDEYLYPVFPFPWYTKVTKDDALAIKAYLFSLAPVHAPRKPLEIGFPFDIRTGLLTWRTLFFKAGTFAPDKSDSAEVQRGDYIVNGLGHCGECHNHSKLTGASDWSGKLEGGKIEGWYAPNITSDGKQGVGQWSKEGIVKYLKTGVRPDDTTVALGPMRETIDDSLSKMNDEDLGAIAAYLKSTAAKQTVDNEDSSKAVPVSAGAADAYLSHCASCHQRDGKGIPGAIPSLAGNGAVMTKGPQNVIRAVLGGIQAHGGLAPMPALGQTMSDEEVAQAVNYVRKSWGNNAPDNVAAGAVGDLRKKALTMLAMNADQPCAPIEDESLKKAIDQGDTRSKLEAMSLDTMLPTIDAVLPAIRKTVPDAKPDAITNALSAAYCPVALEKVPAPHKSQAMGNFAVLVYGQAKKTVIKN